MNLHQVTGQEPRASGINRREAFQQLLGLAGGTCLVTSGLGGLSRARAENQGGGEGNGNVIRVEEDWYVKIGVPEGV